MEILNVIRLVAMILCGVVGAFLYLVGLFGTAVCVGPSPKISLAGKSFGTLFVMFVSGLVLLTIAFSLALILPLQ